MDLLEKLSFNASRSVGCCQSSAVPDNDCSATCQLFDNVRVFRIFYKSQFHKLFYKEGRALLNRSDWIEMCQDYWIKMSAGGWNEIFQFYVSSNLVVDQTLAQERKKEKNFFAEFFLSWTKKGFFFVQRSDSNELFCCLDASASNGTKTSGRKLKPNENLLIV